MSAVDDWLQHDDKDEAEECAECGHEHFDPVTQLYLPCPLAGEGCTCPYREGEQSCSVG